MLNKISNLDLCDILKDWSHEQLNNVSYWHSFIYHCVGLSLNVERLKISDNMKHCWGGFKCKQYPNELAKFLVFIYENRNSINSYFEIGVEKGGTFFLVDSLLRVTNPNYKYSTGIEINHYIGRNQFTSYAKKYGTVTFQQIDSNDFKLNRTYDLCFIDGDHSYLGLKKDFYRVEDISRFVAMHDVKFEPGCVKFWNELKLKNKYTSYQELLNEDTRFPNTLGFGITKI